MLTIVDLIAIAGGSWGFFIAARDFVCGPDKHKKITVHDLFANVLILTVCGCVVISAGHDFARVWASL